MANTKSESQQNELSTEEKIALRKDALRKLISDNEDIDPTADFIFRGGTRPAE